MPLSALRKWKKYLQRAREQGVHERDEPGRPRRQRVGAIVERGVAEQIQRRRCVRVRARDGGARTAAADARSGAATLTVMRLLVAVVAARRAIRRRLDAGGRRRQ